MGTVLPHRASRIEARIHTHIDRRLTARGWVPVVLPTIGYGGEGWVRVLARVLLRPPERRDSEREDTRGWRRFVSASTAGVAVTIRVGDHTHVVRSDVDGYLDVRLDAELAPGWATARFSIDDGPEHTAPLHVVGPTTRLGLVSDIDDTVIVTMLPRPLRAFRNAFLVRENERRPVPGMADLYQQVIAEHPDVFVVYLSTGAWNTARPLIGFLDRHGYPRGPLLMTDWGPTAEGWFRSGQAHKHAQLSRLLDELPQLRWLLVGDDGQHDPEIYAEVAAMHPGRVLGVAIRQLTLTEQLAHVAPTGRPTGRATLPDTEPPLDGDAVCAPDGFGLAEGLRARGVVLTPGRPQA